MGKEKGVFKGEKCGRNGCEGIICEGEKEGCCSCHINPPCSYCTTQTEYCPTCGWSAEEDQRAYEESHKMQYSHLEYKPKLLSDLDDYKFGYVIIGSGANSVIRIKGKHQGLKMSEIYKKLGLSENPNMPRMKRFTNSEFELTYFCD